MKRNDDERLLSRSEVDEIFGISTRFLELAASRGEGPRLIKIGRLVRYRFDDIRSWIDAQVIDPVKGPQQ